MKGKEKTFFTLITKFSFDTDVSRRHLRDSGSHKDRKTEEYL